MRTKKTFSNIFWGFAYELIAIICGFIVPRLVLTSFGSQYNGVTSAVSQFMQVIALFQAGIGGVTMAALYKPLVEKDTKKISVIVKTTEGFMRKIVLTFLVFTVLLAYIYPFSINDEFDWFFTFTLVLIMSLSTIAQYFFGQTYQFLLNADQCQRIISIVNTIKLVANTFIFAVMIKNGYGIREVKLTAAVVYIAAPILLNIYTKKKYRLIPSVAKDNSVIKQRWDNFGQQVAVFISVNTSFIVLTLFSTIYEISVYAVYSLIFNGIYGLLLPLTKGVEAAFGNMLAKEEHERIFINLRIYEQVVFAATTFLYAVALITAISFISLYTARVTDVSYYRPTFLYIMIAANVFRCFRFPYEGICIAAGHFRQTRNPAFIEAGLNIIISVSLVFSLGIIGVAIGSLVAFVFRTIRFALYMSRNIVERSIRPFIKRVILSGMCILLIVGINSTIPLSNPHNYMSWMLNAIIVSVIAVIPVALVEVIFYRGDLMVLLAMIKGVRKKRKTTVSFSP